MVVPRRVCVCVEAFVSTEALVCVEASVWLCLCGCVRLQWSRARACVWRDEGGCMG